MSILVIMGIGIFVGIKYFPKKWLKINEKIQMMSMFLLIFCMGVTLGNKPDFINNIGTLGVEGSLFALLPILFSTLIVYGLTEKWMRGKKDD